MIGENMEISFSYDESVDAAYIRLCRRINEKGRLQTLCLGDKLDKFIEQERFGGAGFNLDFDDEGNLVGIEILDFKKVIRR